MQINYHVVDRHCIVFIYFISGVLKCVRCIKVWICNLMQPSWSYDGLENWILACFHLHRSVLPDCLLLLVYFLFCLAGLWTYLREIIRVVLFRGSQTRYQQLWITSATFHFLFTSFLSMCYSQVAQCYSVLQLPVMLHFIKWAFQILYNHVTIQ